MWFKKQKEKQNKATQGAGEMFQQSTLVENWWVWFLVPASGGLQLPISSSREFRTFWSVCKGTCIRMSRHTHKITSKRIGQVLGQF